MLELIKQALQRADLHLLRWVQTRPHLVQVAGVLYREQAEVLGTLQVPRHHLPEQREQPTR